MDHELVRAIYRLYRDACLDTNSGLLALAFEHVHDIVRGTVTEQMAEFLLMERHVVSTEQTQKILRRITSQRRFDEVGIGGEKRLGTSVQVREVTPAAPRDQNLAADSGISLQHDHPASAAAGLDGAHQARSAGAEDHHIRP